MNYSTRRCLILSHFLRSTTNQERDFYEEVLKLKTFERDITFLRKEGYMEESSLKLTKKGTNMSNGMLNLYINPANENLNYWIRKVARLKVDGKITQAQYDQILWEAFASMPEEFQNRINHLGADTTASPEELVEQLTEEEIIE